MLAGAENLVGDKLSSGVDWEGRRAQSVEVAALIAALRPVGDAAALARFGPAGDGGYLLPDDFAGVRACVSPGVFTEVGFDLALAARGIDVHMADASVAGPPVDHPRFHFTRKFFDTFNSDTTVTIDDFCAGVGGGEDLILQMDIEGAEYRVLTSAAEATLARFRIMVIEFHDLDFLFSYFGIREIGAVFRRLLRTHAVVHIHPNNTVAAVRHGDLVVPPLLEFTFLRRDRLRPADRKLQFPHPLDADCYPNAPGMVLPECWQG